MDTRSIVEEDIKEVYEFWENSYKVSDRDTVERIKSFIAKNPDISTLAIDGGKVVGTTLGSYDGRKGYVYKVVVDDEHKGTGLGARLVKETIKRCKTKVL